MTKNVEKCLKNNVPYFLWGRGGGEEKVWNNSIVKVTLYSRVVE